WWGCKNADYSSTSRTEYLSCILTTGTFILFDKKYSATSCGAGKMPTPQYWIIYVSKYYLGVN
ncbi:hypothetical protein, partial [Nostoc sp.]|uniref:hypothetical protein n=1 Tax=Nostoc sp. TaxID=1180 RepID=UPI002FF98975